MRAAVDKLTIETQQQRNNNVALQQHLQQLRVTLATGFANTSLPGMYDMCILIRLWSKKKCGRRNVHGVESDRVIH